MVFGYEEHNLSFVQLFEASLPVFCEHIPSGMSSRIRAVAGANVLAGHPDFCKGDIGDIGPSLQLFIEENSAELLFWNSTK